MCIRDRNNSDWAILTTDDGTNEAGIYVFDGTNYTLAKLIPEVFNLIVLTQDSTSIAFTGDGNAGTPISGTVKFDPLPTNLAKDVGNGVLVDLADVKSGLTFDCELQDLAGTTLGYISSAANFQ